MDKDWQRKLKIGKKYFKLIWFIDVFEDESTHVGHLMQKSFKLNPDK